jgi:hypothetical protein
MFQFSLSPLQRALLRGAEASIGVAATIVVTLVGAGTLKPGWSLYASAAVLAVSAGVRPVAREISDRRGSNSLARERAVAAVIDAAFVDVHEQTGIPVRNLTIRAYRWTDLRRAPEQIGQMTVRVQSEQEQALVQPLMRRCLTVPEPGVDEVNGRFVLAVPMLDGAGRAVGCIVVEVPVGNANALQAQQAWVEQYLRGVAGGVWNAANIKSTS